MCLILLPKLFVMCETWINFLLNRNVQDGSANEHGLHCDQMPCDTIPIDPTCVVLSAGTADICEIDGCILNGNAGHQTGCIYLPYESLTPLEN